MRILLDTHVVLWMATDSEKLHKKIRSLISDDEVQKFVSISSAWEVTIKIGHRKFGFIGEVDDFYNVLDVNGLKILNVEKEYLDMITKIKKYHKDPFDHMIIATAIAEDMTLITADKNIHRYDVNWIW